MQWNRYGKVEDWKRINEKATGTSTNDASRARPSWGPRGGWQRPPALTCDPDLVELSEFLIVAFSRDIVPQADGAQGNKTKIKGLQKVPVVLQDGEHGGRDEKETNVQDDPV